MKRITPPTELRLSLRAAAMLVIVPQACTVAALIAILLDTHDRAATFSQHHAAQAETVPPATPTPHAQPSPTPEALRAALYDVLTGPPATQQPPQSTEDHFSLKSALDRILQARPSKPETLAPPTTPQHPAMPLAQRLANEFDDAFANFNALDAFNPDDLAPEDRLAELHSLITDLQDLQGSVAQLRGATGSGLGGARGGLGNAAVSLNQLLPLLNAVQGLRTNGTTLLNRDPALAPALDRFLGNDNERPHRLALLLLLSWVLDTPADA